MIIQQRLLNIKDSIHDLAKIMSLKCKLSQFLLDLNETLHLPQMIKFKCSHGKALTWCECDIPTILRGSVKKSEINAELVL